MLEEELVGDGGGDPALLPIVVPPETARHDSPFEEQVMWIDDPDGEGIICAPVRPGGPGCAKSHEVAEYLAQLNQVEREGDALYEEETGLSTGRDDIDHLDD